MSVKIQNNLMRVEASFSEYQPSVQAFDYSSCEDCKTLKC